MKRGYESPTLQLILLAQEDVVATSAVDTDEIPLD